MTVTGFSSTGSSQEFIVAPGSTWILIEAYGAEGFQSNALGGKGGWARGSFILAPGTVLQVNVGGKSTNIEGGWNGGGHAGAVHGAGGGGASDVRIGGFSLAERILTAGGGGGGGYGAGGTVNVAGGYGGGSSGRAGYGGPGAAGGAAGTQTTGYAPGIGGPSSNAGGGGGGGWFGGAGGGNGGGGGGSGHLSSAAILPSMLNDQRLGSGLVTIWATNAPPMAPTVIAPPANGLIVASVNNTLSWATHDSDPGDYCTRVDIRWKVSGAGTWATTLTGIATTGTSYVLPAGSWPAGALMEWQICSYDASSAQSPFSASRFTNTLAALGPPTITSPTNGALLYVSPVELDWTTGALAADAYQVQRCDSAAGLVIYYDSGQIISTARSALLPLDMSMGRSDYLRARYRYGGLWSPWASVSVVAQLAPPQTPIVYPVQSGSGRPQVVVTISCPAGTGGLADTLVCDLYRTSPDGTTVRIFADLPPNSTVVDDLPTAGANEYIAVAYSASGASATSPTGYYPNHPSFYHDIYSDVY
jgi:hypothetical protein